MSSGKILSGLCVVAALCISSCVAQSLTVAPTELAGEEGETFKFVCMGPSTGINWWYNPQATGGEERKLVTGGDYSVVISIINDTAIANLTIQNAGTDKTGFYICRVTSPDQQFQAKLTVHPVRDVVINPAMPEYVEGGDLNLNCTVNGAVDQVTWSFNNGQGPVPLKGGDESTHVQVINETLTVRAMTSADAGIYICTHTFEAYTKTAEVNVGGEITLSADKSVKFTEGDRALLKCEATVLAASLLPNITWLMDGDEWQTRCANRCEVVVKTTELMINSELILNKITMDDRLNFTCIASNSGSEVTRYILLRVRDRLAALWPFLGIVIEVVILILIIFIHEKCSKGEDIGEEDEDEDDPKKEKSPMNDGDSGMRMRSEKQ